MTLSLEARAAIQADVDLSRAIRRWDADKSHILARHVLACLRDPKTVSALASDVQLWERRATNSASG